MYNAPNVGTNRLLLPISWLFETGVNFRNLLFDRGILKSKRFSIPIICVGNITVGGTGKTPHVEYLIKLLSPHYKVAVLSRGYKRKSKGFQIVRVNSKALEVGDEPLQIKKKFPKVQVVVDGNRRRAIEKMLSASEEQQPEVILMDDGFQHRYVTPSLSLLLVNSNRPPFKDKLLPAGNLREPTSGLHRASIILVTKCSPDMAPIDFRTFSEGLQLSEQQKLFFTSLGYRSAVPIFPELQPKECGLNQLREKQVFLIAGIAYPKPLIETLKQKTDNLYSRIYPDHHFYSDRDIENIESWISSIEGDDENKIVITTEKDATKLLYLESLSERIRSMLYILPVEVTFLGEEQKDKFNKTILDHVRKNQRNS